jgi:hypothetical protein
MSLARMDPTWPQSPSISHALNMVLTRSTGPIHQPELNDALAIEQAEIEFQGSIGASLLFSITNERRQRFCTLSAALSFGHRPAV